ncbi:cellulase family glycosylhydrolase [Lewinella sp. JB7]|uniref:cellulase family glycosylhydrolase n=1 Tax=Lewinella sp. JB7 TaxID=2962887 RepID=UPI0020CA0A28|nr:cellulase family glycosylhydrolase [Lewinella sp. JB7]MCP9237254.1 cellulase family glycosylhydrolase [Lewinella sp. JB7]
MKPIMFLLLFTALFSCGNPAGPGEETVDGSKFVRFDTSTVAGRWSKERAQAYYDDRPWIVGANYNNRGAINQLEMFQAATFDTAQISEELAWASSIGMNSMRVYLHNLLWEQDSTAFLDRLEQYLGVADRHGISTTFVLFDAVWNPESQLGPQPAPKPHTHNSGWVQSPPERQLPGDRSHFPQFKSYVQGILRHFDGDERIFMYDLYNEPDNNNFGKFPNERANTKGDRVFPLLRSCFEWGREVNPSQPLTAGVWIGDLRNPDSLGAFNAFQLNNSDIISFHSYGTPEQLQASYLDVLPRYGRPIVCTEYMARTNGSTFAGYLPVFREQNIGAYNWGLVSGKSQTIYPWSSWDSTFTAEPHRWFHDVFRPDGTAYDSTEVALIKELTAR